MDLLGIPNGADISHDDPLQKRAATAECLQKALCLVLPTDGLSH